MVAITNVVSFLGWLLCVPEGSVVISRYFYLLIPGIH